MTTGRVCKKVSGRDAGQYCVILDKADKKHVLVEGFRIKSRKVNISHLEPLPIVVDISKDSKKEDILTALKEKGLA